MTRTQQTGMSILFVAVLILGGWAWSQDDPVASPSDTNPALESSKASDDAEAAPTQPEDEAAPVSPPPEDAAVETPADSPARAARQDIVASLWIFVLSVWLGVEVISKVPPTLHTPLMSGSNAISGIALLGAVIVAAALVEDISPLTGRLARFLGFVAVTLAMINAVGGFMVTHRMLAMFTRK